MNNINDLRESLFDTIRLLKEGKIGIQEANTIANIGQVVINSAKAEIEYLDKIGGMSTDFIPNASTAKLDRPKADYQITGTSHETVKKKYA